MLDHQFNMGSHNVLLETNYDLWIINQLDNWKLIMRRN